MAKKRRGKRGARKAAAPRRKAGRKKAVVRKAVRRKPRRAKAPTKRPARNKKRSPRKLAPRKLPSQAPPTTPIAVDVAEQEALRAKFELGPHEWTRELDAREKAQTIPWGYGRDRVTAMAVDPERLFVYWEVTDEAIARARAALAADEAGTLTLRVHDVTGLLFDGDNAHHHVDLDVGRAERQRFHHVGRPSSSAIVELGLRAGDGRFAAIVRSRRVDFPRREPAPPGPVEWLTVREESFAPRSARLAVTPATPPSPPSSPSSRSQPRRAANGALRAAPSAAATLELDRTEFEQWFVARFGPLAWAFDGDEFEWLGPGGDAGVASDGPILVSEADGITRVELPPWSVTLANDDGRGAQRLLARWELRRAWMVHTAGLKSGQWRRTLRATTTFTASDSSGSEPRLTGAAALELGGASERLGASFPTLPPPPVPLD
jgi:hypothetical protein